MHALTQVSSSVRSQVAYPGGVIPDIHVAETTDNPKVCKAAEDLEMLKSSMRRNSAQPYDSGSANGHAMV